MRKLFKTLNVIYDRLLMVVLLLVFLIVVYGIYDTYYILKNAPDDNLLKYKPTATDGVPDDAPITDDMVAWLTIDDTNIDYPVMQGGNNSEYINKNPYGEYSLSGSIFLDSRNASDFTDKYSIVYGHHMEYGKMFGALDDFLNESYLKKHTKGELIIGKDAHKRYTLEVFAVMRVNARVDEIFQVGNALESAEYIKENSYIYTAEKNKRIVALSTCLSGNTEDRTVVFCYILDED